MCEQERTVLDGGLISIALHVVQVDGSSSLAKSGALVSNSPCMSEML